MSVPRLGVQGRRADRPDSQAKAFRPWDRQNSFLRKFRVEQCGEGVSSVSTTSRYRVIQYTLRGRRRNPMAWGLARFLKAVANGGAKKVFAEDGAIDGAIQRGLEASPHRGGIGTREERIFVFQQYVLEKCRSDVGTGFQPVRTTRPQILS